MPKKWHHDIKYIILQSDEVPAGISLTGTPPYKIWVEEAVMMYQSTKSEVLLQKIMDNYMIFQFQWARDFAPYLDGGIDEGKDLFVEVVWRSAEMFDMSKLKKPMGKAFNAYLTSALMNKRKTLKTQRFKGPPIECQVCGARMSYIDEKHLEHAMTIKTYREMFPTYPLVSHDGKTLCPYTGEKVNFVTIERVNRVAGYYTVEDWMKEYGGLFPDRRCPLTGLNIGENYPEILAPMYTVNDLKNDFPNFQVFIKCPVTEKEIFYVTQRHLDENVNKERTKRISMAEFARAHPRATLYAKQVPVVNPYTNETTMEITLEDLKAANTTVREHVQKYHTIVINQLYEKEFVCPFTGRLRESITTNELKDLGVTPMQFYLATCKYPLRKFKVRCAVCGKWVENIWSHLEEANHSYATPMSVSEYEQKHGARSRSFMVIKTSMENDEGDDTKLTDLVSAKVTHPDIMMDLQHALKKVATTDLDRRIAGVIKSCRTVEDIVDRTVEKKTIHLSRPFSMDEEDAVKKKIGKSLGIEDFEIERSSEASLLANVLIPSKRTVLSRIKELRTLIAGV
jgi:uncharacterized Zn finger protein (UPF0148 family)